MDHLYRIIIVGSTGKRFCWNMTDTEDKARELLEDARENYEGPWNDSFVERRVVSPWERFEPRVPMNQSSLPI